MTLLIIAALIVLVGYFWYVSIITKRNKALEALSTIDVQLKQRYDLIPNILAIAKRFMEHEAGLLQSITELRTRAQQPYAPSDRVAVTEHLALAEQLAGKMGQLMVSVENYPDLKSDATMVQAMQSYNEVEAQIAAARRFYNAAVNALNTSIQIVPGNIIAGMAGVQALPLYQAEAAVHEPVDAAKLLK
jgi:LemA protein